MYWDLLIPTPLTNHVTRFVPVHKFSSRDITYVNNLVCFYGIRGLVYDICWLEHMWPKIPNSNMNTVRYVNSSSFYNYSVKLSLVTSCFQINSIGNSDEYIHQSGSFKRLMNQVLGESEYWRKHYKINHCNQ